MQTDKRNNYRKKLADKATGGKGSASTEITEAGETAEGNGDGPPAAKKAKVDESWQNREEDPMDDIADETLDEHLDQDMEEEQEEEDADQEEEEGEGEEEPPEEREEEEREEDEALDNGEDSD
jgi:DNA polymerase epsilon subunit 3